MDYNAELLLRNLERRISLFEPEEKVPPDRNFIDTNIGWNPSYFFEKILLAGEISVVRTKELQQIVNDFEEGHNFKVSLANLYSKFWLRDILGLVEIPTTIRYAVSRFEEVKDRIDELRFLRQLPVKEDLKISLHSFNDELKKFNALEKRSIEFDNSEIKYFVSNEKDILKLSHPAYYEHFIDFENEFTFLSYLKSKMTYGNRPTFLLVKDEFIRIWKTHKDEFISTPEINELEQLRVVEKYDEDKFQVTAHDYWAYFGNQTASSLFITLAKTDELDRWADLMFSQGWMRDFRLFIGGLNPRQQLLDFILSKIRNDSDLEPFTDEIPKARLDCTRDLISLKPNTFFNPSLSLEAIDSLYQRSYKMDRIAEESNSNLLMIQDSRNNVDILIRFILANDGFHRETQFYYTKQLLSLGFKKPYVSYTVCEYLQRDFFKLLPQLIHDLNYSPVALYLVGQLKVPTKLVPSLKDEIAAKEEVLQTLWDDSFEIFYQRLSNELLSSNYDTVLVGNIIYEYFHLVTRWKFETHRHGFKYQKQFWESSKLEESMDRLYNLKAVSINPSKIYSTILDKIESISLEKRANGVITLPSVKLDMMARFIRWTDKAPLQEKDRTELLAKAIASFGSTLNSSFNKPYNTYKSKPIFGVHKQLNQFHWGKVCVVLRDHNLIDKLLFKLDLVIPDRTSKSNGKNNDLIRYDDSVRFQTERVRTYFFLISKIYREIIGTHKDRTLIKQIEAFYADLVNRFTVDKFATDQINVLHTDFEYSYGFDRLRLLPEIVYDLNCFIDSDLRVQAIKALGDRLAFNQLVEVWYYLSSEGDKKALLNQISTIALERLLTESRWLPDIELTLRILGWSNLFQSEMTTVIEKLQNSKSKKFTAIIFQLRLYKLYHNNDLEGIRNLIVPEANGVEISAKDFLTEKNLMEALVFHRLKKYDNAIEILKGLNQRNQKLVYALNIFAGLIGKGEHEKNPDTRNSLINDALSYWEKEKATLNIDDSDELGVVAWYNELTAFDLVKRYDEFETLFRKIPAAYKMTSLLLHARVSNLIRQGRDVESDQLLLVATDYHRQHDGSLPEFLVELTSQATSPTQITRLQISYLQILGKSPTDLIKIIPDKINPSKESLASFLTNEIQYCLLELVKRVRSISDIKKETKYNDLFATILQARISMVDWVVKDNSTGNKSGKGPDPGERDIVIQSNGQEIAIVECLHINGRSKKYICEHVNKLFEYSSLKIPRFIICYYKGKHPNFKNSWLTYKNQTFLKMIFKDDYIPRPKSIKAIASNSNAIFMGRSAHKGNHELIHIFVNLHL
jgi:hypothetical protein